MLTPNCLRDIAAEAASKNEQAIEYLMSNIRQKQLLV